MEAEDPEEGPQVRALGNGARRTGCGRAGSLWRRSPSAVLPISAVFVGLSAGSGIGEPLSRSRWGHCGWSAR